MKVTISASETRISGCVAPPPSKSIVHRVMIAHALASGGIVCDPNICDDTTATYNALSAVLGVDGNIADVGESGSTLRFIIPVAAALGRDMTYVMHGNLSKRPLNPYACLNANGVTYTKKGDRLSVHGTLAAGTFMLLGGVSSQFFTGLMFALPLLSGASVIRAHEAVVSKAYIKLTLDVLREYGIVINETVPSAEWTIPGGQKYVAPCGFADAIGGIETDMSAAAFWVVANAVAGGITTVGIPQTSEQGDFAVLDIVNNDNRHTDRTIDGGEIPDIVPILAVYGCCRAAKLTIANCSRLRIKECDRLSAIVGELRKLSANIRICDDAIVINADRSGGIGRHGGQHSGGTHGDVVVIDSHNDHRIAMSLAIAAVAFNIPVVITSAECVRKSYVKFWNDLKSLGVNLVISD